MRNKYLLCLVVGLFAFAGPALAQVTLTTGSIFGKVTDEKGAPLPGVSVTLESPVIRTQVASTGASGGFRFANLPPSTYSVNFALEGFTEVRQEEVRVSTGSTVELSITLKPSLAEEFTVIGETPVVDTSDTSNADTYNKEYLEQVPSGRDPWVILDQTPGIDVDRVNVAGSESGQQSIFFSRGSSGDGIGWNYDGVNITDPSAAGASPTYYDFDAFEEIEVVTAGNDASVQTGDITLNFVTKRPGNKVAINGSYFYSDDSLQSDKAPDLSEAGVGQTLDNVETRANHLDRVYAAGFDIGGPAIKDRLFGWFAYKKEDIGLFKSGVLDRTILKDWNAKAIFNLNSANESQFAYFKGDKIKHGRPAFGADIQGPETLYEQGGPGEITPGIWSGSHTFIPNDNTIVTGHVGYIGLGFSLVPPGGNTVPIIYLSAVPHWEETLYNLAILDRPAWDYTADVNYFKENMAGGDHEFKFGFEFKRANIHSTSTYGIGYAIYDYNQTTPYGPLTDGRVKVQHYVDGNTQSSRLSFYAQDTFRRDRLTLNLGVRYDHQTGLNKGVSIPGVPGWEDFVGAFDYQGGDVPVKFDDISPRIGATYDVSGDGKTVIRGNFARYYDGFGTATILNFSNPTFVYNGANFYFTNLNGDRRVQRDELTGGPFYYGGLGPGAFDLNGFLDKHLYGDLTNSGSWEALAGFERQLAPDLSVGATYTWRRYVNFIPANAPVPGVPFGITQDDFVPSGSFTFTAIDGEVFNVPTFSLPTPHDGTMILENVDGYTQTYNGIDLVVRKRMSNNFLLNSSFTWQQQKGHYDGNLATGFIVPDGGLSGTPLQYDPGALPFLDDAPYAYGSTGSGKSGIFPYAEWSWKLSGVYQFPWDVSVGAFARYQQGYPIVIFGSVSDASLAANYGTSGHRIWVEKIGDRRLDNLFTLDLSVQKGIDFGNAGKLTLQADLFNIINSVKVLDRQRSITSSQFLWIRDNISPFAIRFGARYGF
jgi:hypothetical protein